MSSPCYMTIYRGVYPTPACMVQTTSLATARHLSDHASPSLRMGSWARPRIGRSRGALAESGRSHQHPTLRPTMKHIRLSRAWHRPRASPLPYAGPIVQDTLSSWPRGPDSTMALGGRREGVV